MEEGFACEVYMAFCVVRSEEQSGVEESFVGEVYMATRVIRSEEHFCMYTSRVKWRGRGFCMRGVHGNLPCTLCGAHSVVHLRE